MKELLLKILDLSYEISNKTNTKVFFEYYSHVDRFTLHYYLNKYSREKEPIYIVSSERINKENLEKAIKELEKIKEDVQI